MWPGRSHSCLHTQPQDQSVYWFREALTLWCWSGRGLLPQSGTTRLSPICFIRCECLICSVLELFLNPLPPRRCLHRGLNEDKA